MREKDACWEYGDKLDGNRVRCRFCQKVINGGISRFKFHLSQIPSKGVNPCVKVTDDVREKVIALIEAKESHRELELLKRKRVAELSVLPKRTRELPSQPSSPGLPASPAIIPARYLDYPVLSPSPVRLQDWKWNGALRNSFLRISWTIVLQTPFHTGI